LPCISAQRGRLVLAQRRAHAFDDVELGALDVNFDERRRFNRAGCEEEPTWANLDDGGGTCPTIEVPMIAIDALWMASFTLPFARPRKCLHRGERSV
jgi:hypothetical protein